MPLPINFGSMNTALTEMQTAEILQLNEKSGKYGLVLTAAEAGEIIEAKKHVLQSYGRIEFDAGITGKLILNFCASPFIHQEDYVSTLTELQEIFYYLKNETEDELGDDELLEIIKNYFNHSCGGSLELLKGKELEAFARDFRRNNQIMDWEGEE